MLPLGKQIKIGLTSRPLEMWKCGRKKISFCSMTERHTIHCLTSEREALRLHEFRVSAIGSETYPPQSTWPATAFLENCIEENASTFPYFLFGFTLSKKKRKEYISMKILNGIHFSECCFGNFQVI